MSKPSDQPGSAPDGTVKKISLIGDAEGPVELTESGAMVKLSGSFGDHVAAENPGESRVFLAIEGLSAGSQPGSYDVYLLLSGTETSSEEFAGRISLYGRRLHAHGTEFHFVLDVTTAVASLLTRRVSSGHQFSVRIKPAHDWTGPARIERLRLERR